MKNIKFGHRYKNDNREYSKKNSSNSTFLFSAISLQKKWKGLRTCYGREVKRKKITKSGSEADRKSEYVYFKQLQFLQKVTAVRESPEQDEGEGQENVADNGEMSADRSTKKQTKRKLPKHVEQENDPIILTLQKSIDSRERQHEEELDEDRMFLLSLLSSLKKVPEETKMTTKIKILTILNEAVDNKQPGFRATNYDEGYRYRNSAPHMSQPIYKKFVTSHYHQGYQHSPQLLHRINTVHPPASSQVQSMSSQHMTSQQASQPSYHMLSTSHTYHENQHASQTMIPDPPLPSNSMSADLTIQQVFQPAYQNSPMPDHYEGHQHTDPVSSPTGSVPSQSDLSQTDSEDLVDLFPLNKS